MTARDYREGDLDLLLRLCQQLWPRVRVTYGTLAWWAAELPNGGFDLRLWFDGDELQGWAWSSGGALEFETRDDALLGEMLAWARPQRVWAPAGDAAVRAHGLRPVEGAHWFRRNERDLDGVEAPSPPEGYVLRTVEARDFPSRVEAHRSGFSPSRFTEETYAYVRSTSPYRQELDCVAVAPDGAVAAYALAWLDAENRVGELEPVATHAGHRRLGAGRAVNLFALQRLREEGATRAIVGCRGDDAYPVPRLLYESVGFREVSRTVPFATSASTSASE